MKQSSTTAAVRNCCSRNFPKSLSVLLLPLVLGLAGCGKDAEQVEAPPRPVRTVTVELSDTANPVSLTGRIEARNEAGLGFRIAGRLIERSVNVGDVVEPGEIIAKLDPQNELNALSSAQAALNAANGQLNKSRNAFERQEQLLANGFTTRAVFDQAQQALLAATSQVDDASARLKLARDQVAFTELKADTAGVVTARGAEPGEVVQAGQMIVQIARENGRDAVFDVPAQLLRNLPPDPLVTVRLNDNAAVTAQGRVREVAPQADPATRTFPVRVGLIDPPAAIRLGAGITGSVVPQAGSAINLPASALTRIEGAPAVWVVDPATESVSLRNIEVAAFDPAMVVVSQGLEVGEIVVTAGVQALHPGQVVRLLGVQP
ncbi:efflux RND transporter periplasmic adaptor subunit [Aureimonas fodinaquatilis]|uniref:Efflux RND transporter periplasmic adaptor subunit n=1 Tax=Aureimonas fodinaquatilis TaxID=2565783 RepID=A0A5B0E2F9_9HYPH|nr:efflux RND transporter periplasmic adaptor subunit [Aureimonas fodinaquatilis]KAA0971930.1 efflux RND transporter periplasmic adaptor subunit [Aureimonas fodinaquatilis]